MTNRNDLITLAEAARRSGHSPVTLRQAAQRRTLKVQRVGEGNRATLYTTMQDVTAYLDHRRTWRSYGSGEREREETNG
jgi:hypothetical protein